MIELTNRRMVLLAIVAVVCIGICVVAGYYGARGWSARADAMIIKISDLDTYRAYEGLDRDQALMLSESQKLQIRFEEDNKRKLEIRKRLNVPENYVEKREDDKNPQSPVIGFSAPPDGAPTSK